MLAYHERASERLLEHKSRVRTDGSVVVDHQSRVRQQEMTTKPPDVERIGCWRTALTADEQGQFEAIAGRLLRELGYR